jgi:small subunit ribosomal protein S3
VGQKTHPTGFRTGVNKSHNAIWFANYGAYSDVLKEDYKIRKFFEKKFESVYSKAGIAKLEIQRKINQLELVIHAARPKAIAAETATISTSPNVTRIQIGASPRSYKTLRRITISNIGGDKSFADDLNKC